MEASSYQEVRQLRNQQIKEFSFDHFKLNQLHDHIMTQVVKIAIDNIKEKYGSPPAPFSFFVMGSAGRFEQAVWSDQDHGIIYEETDSAAENYFLHLGKEISEGLYQAGYEFCRGGVMAGNTAWCKSRKNWHQQITNWISESSWEAIRNLLILIDSRSLYGEAEYLHQLKKSLFQAIQKENMYQRIFENTMYFQKGVGILGQFLVEEYGKNAGTLNLKEKVLFPFVNAIRFLAVKENIIESPTLVRLDKLSAKLLPNKDIYVSQFLLLLNYRLLYGNHKDYETGHFLSIGKLSKVEKKELREIIKTATSLCQYVRRLVEKEGYHGNE